MPVQSLLSEWALAIGSLLEKSSKPSGKSGRLFSTAKEINRSVINLLNDFF